MEKYIIGRQNKWIGRIMRHEELLKPITEGRVEEPQTKAKIRIHSADKN